MIDARIRIGVLAPRLVAAGLVELLREDAWDPSPWSLQSATPDVLVVWCREDDPMSFTGSIAEHVHCPLVVVTHRDRTPRSPGVLLHGRSVRFLDQHATPQVLRETVRELTPAGSGATAGAHQALRVV